MHLLSVATWQEADLSVRLSCHLLHIPGGRVEKLDLGKKGHPVEEGRLRLWHWLHVLRKRTRWWASVGALWPAPVLLAL